MFEFIYNASSGCWLVNGRRKGKEFEDINENDGDERMDVLVKLVRCVFHVFIITFYHGNNSIHSKYIEWRKSWFNFCISNAFWHSSIRNSQPFHVKFCIKLNRTVVKGMRPSQLLFTIFSVAIYFV